MLRGTLGMTGCWGQKSHQSVLDFAERQAEREQTMTMQDWAEHLDRIMTMSGEQLLQRSGSISHKQAVDKAKVEYKKYKARTISDVESDYLNSLKSLEKETSKY